MKALLTKAAATVIVLFARAVTAVRAVWPEGGLPSRPCVYYANHSSHGDFVLVWTVLPPRLRHRARPVAGAEYWLKSWLNRFIGSDVFNAVLIARDRDKRTEDPVTQMASAIDAGSSLILFPEGTPSMPVRPSFSSRKVHETSPTHGSSRSKAASSIWRWRALMSISCQSGSAISTASCRKARSFRYR